MSLLVLPFDEYVGEVLHSLASNTVTMLQAATGSGKSVKFPLTCREDALRRGWQPRVHTFVPLRLGVMGLYRFQSKRHAAVRGDSDAVAAAPITFGFAAGKVYSYTQQTQIIYSTTGHGYKRLLNILSKATASELTGGGDRMGAFVQRLLQNMASHINIDEVHTQTRENYLVVSLMRFIRDLPGYNKTQGPCWSILSATLDGSEVPRLFPDSRLLCKTKSCFHVQTYFLEEASAAVSYPPLSDEKSRIPLAIECVCQVNEQYGLETVESDILVFASGMHSVDALVEACTLDPRLADNCVALRCYSQLSEAEAELVFEPVPMSQERVDAWMERHQFEGAEGDGGLANSGLQDTILQMMRATRKIVCSTNMAESSITIPGMRCVIDLLLEKTMVRGASADIRSLQVRPISRASAKQRAGRVGRTQDGDYFPVATQAEFESLAECSDNMFHQMDMSVSLLELLDAGLDPIQVLRIKSLRNYYEAMLNLMDLGLIGLVHTPGSADLCSGMRAIIHADEIESQLTDTWLNDVLLKGVGGGDGGSINRTFTLSNLRAVKQSRFTISRHLLPLLTKRQRQLLVAILVERKIIAIGIENKKEGVEQEQE